MSTIKVTNLQNASAASPAIVLDANSRATLNGLSYPTEGSLSGRNRIINGDMRIDQRRSGASISFTNNSDNTLDRYLCMLQGGATGTLTFQRDTVAPTGFTNSLKATVTTADTTDCQAYIGQFIEGYNISDLYFGTAGAKAFTLSFWVRSSIAGTYCGGITGGGSSGNQVGYVFQYSINSANTWEYKTVTIPGETSGSYYFDTTNGVGIRVKFDLGTKGSSFTAAPNAWTAGLKYSSTTAGVVRWKENVNATFYITGVQLEAGSVATPFERRSYGQELALCQRYYQTFGISHGGFSGRIMGTTQSTGVALFGFVFPVKMRATPTTTAYGNGSTTGNFNVNFPTTSSTRTPADFSNAGSGGGDGIAMNVSNTGVNNTACWLDAGVSGNQFSLAMSAEL